MIFKTLFSNLAKIFLVSAIVLPLTAQAYDTGKQYYIDYKTFKSVFNQKATQAHDAYRLSNPLVPYYYYVDVLPKLYPIQLFPDKMPHSMYEIDFNDAEYMPIQYLMFNAEDYEKIIQKTTALTEKFFKGDLTKLYNQMYISFKYMDENGEAFINMMEKTDEGVEKCINYSKTMVDSVKDGRVPKPSEALNYQNSDLGLYSPYIASSDNNVSIMQRHLRTFTSSEYNNFENYIEELRHQVKLIQKDLFTLQKKIAAGKEEKLSGYAALDEGIGKYLENIIALCDHAIELWNSRLDKGTIHGRVFTGDLHLKYNHLVLSYNGKAAIYRSPWYKAFAKCVKAFNDARMECRRIDKDKGREIQMMK